MKEGVRLEIITSFIDGLIEKEIKDDKGPIDVLNELRERHYVVSSLPSGNYSTVQAHVRTLDYITQQFPQSKYETRYYNGILFWRPAGSSEEGNIIVC